MKKRIVLAAVLGLLITLLAGSAYAALVLAERSTSTVGATTVTWDSSFQDLDYSVGDSVNMTVNWCVDAGVATFNGFERRGRGFTPTSKKDPVTGTDPTIGTVSDSSGASTCGSVPVTFQFTDLHFDEEGELEIGNAHFKLKLNVDSDGDGTTDKVASFGVNVHVEDPI
jgi:hypothetical protein